MILTLLGVFLMAWALLRGHQATSDLNLPLYVLAFAIGAIAVILAAIERTPLRTWED